MGLVESLLPEFDRELGVTRRLLARIPEAQFGWAPHPTSMPLGRLAAHLADIPGWMVDIITKAGVERPIADSLDQPPATCVDVLARFDRNVSAARGALVDRTDAELAAPWTLVTQGKVLFTMPKATALRAFVLSHLIHHRGQLSVYLRLQNVAIPSIYGPSGDEPL